MKRKTIGIIAAQLEENTQHNFIEGFLETAFSLDYDVLVFSMHQKYQDTPLREQGDFNIYRLVDYANLDAIVLLLDILQGKGMKESIQNHLHNFYNGPVVVIDSESKYFPSIMMDHRTPVAHLVDHLIEHHGFKDIVFLNGIKEHIHSKQRLLGYIDSMTAHDLPVLDRNIFEGDYWYTSGDSMVEYLINQRNKLPEAIVCANDCMAIGVCDSLTKNGIRIPEDIAVIGYDSFEDGRLSPVPITSAIIPAKQCGIYCANYIAAFFRGETLPPFKADAEEFIGGTCGCNNYSTNISTPARRKHWSTDISTVGIYSIHNHIMADLLSQNNFQDFFSMVYQYIYQIRDFESFDICLNNNWNQPEEIMASAAIRKGYTPTMRHIIHCGRDEETGNTLDFEATFPLKQLLPELQQEHDTPRAYFFMPLFFDDRSFGYTAISYGNKTTVIDECYRLWTRRVMEGIETFQRQEMLRATLAKMEATQIRDGLTGLYNYRGFLNQIQEAISYSEQENKALLLVSVDLSALRDINARYGRDEGNRAICTLSQCIQESTVPGEICARMGNDDFIVGFIVEPDKLSRGDEFIKTMLANVELFNNANDDNSFTISACYDSSHVLIKELKSLEQMINDVVSSKNRKKIAEQKLKAKQENLSKEDLEQDSLVESILNNNSFTYHFQPIVDAHTGEIYSYEALMRANVEQRVSPLAILDSARRLERLYDVEKATFFNVLQYIEDNENKFINKKVFINSIPGTQLSKEDEFALNQRLFHQDGRVVIELTEQEELDDNQLDDIKEQYAQLKIETALDDYGSGYSNINNLLRYMPKYVKIDRMLMTEIQDNPQKQHFVKDIIEFAHDNDIMALAEGIETSEELKEVIRLGADLIQGYYTARPQAEPIQSIDHQIRNEIVQHSQSVQGNAIKKRYVIEQPDSVSLVQLALKKYTELHVKKSASSNEPIKLFGATGFDFNAKIWFEEGYRGVLVLDNASFLGEKGVPCIDLAENVSLTIILKGDNSLLSGGIRVPETSSLTFEGDGNLLIEVGTSRHYGIGNTLESYHGPLNFNQDGGITIRTKGMKGIAIGSGRGGEIAIHKGWYRIELCAQESVGIGSFVSPANISIERCDLEVFAAVGRSCLIGSFNQTAIISIENGLIKLSANASCDDVIALGTLGGQQCKVNLHKLNISFDIRSVAGYAIGSHKADDMEILINQATVKVDCNGNHTYAMGNDNSTAKITAINCDLESSVKNHDFVDIRTDEQQIRIINGSTNFILNNNKIERNVLNAGF